MKRYPWTSSKDQSRREIIVIPDSVSRLLKEPCFSVSFCQIKCTYVYIYIHTRVYMYIICCLITLIILDVYHICIHILISNCAWQSNNFRQRLSTFASVHCDIEGLQSTCYKLEGLQYRPQDLHATIESLLVIPRFRTKRGSADKQGLQFFVYISLGRYEFDPPPILLGIQNSHYHFW